LWDDLAGAEVSIAHTGDVDAAMKRWAAGRGYLDAIGDEEFSRIDEAFGPERLLRRAGILGLDCTASRFIVRSRVDQPSVPTPVGLGYAQPEARSCPCGRRGGAHARVQDTGCGGFGISP
jgi:hypothetical protein